jgi:signal transduction histidine kinase
LVAASVVESMTVPVPNDSSAPPRSRRALAITLAAGLGSLVIMLSLVAVWTVKRLSHAAGRYETAAREAVDGLLLAERLRGSMDEAVANGRGYLLTGDAPLLARLRHSEDVVQDLLDKLTARATGPDDQPSIARVRGAHGDYRASLDEAISRRGQGARHQDVIALFEGELMPRRNLLEKAIDAFVAERGQKLSRLRQEVEDGRARALSGAIATLAAGIMVSALVAALFGRHLARLYHRERLALERAERATTAREELLAVVAHDLRSPLSAIALRASLLKGRSGAEKAPAHGQAIERLVANTDRLLRTMLDLASMDAGRFSVEVSDCPAAAVLEQVVDVFGGLAASKSVVLACEPEQATCTLRADRERLFQVFANLVGNALKFAPPGSVVSVVARAEGKLAHFFVKDEGQGIAATDLPFIFERFWIGRVGPHKGTGLGLHIARRIVEAQGGRIWAESAAGSGTTIHFTVPVAVAERGAAERLGALQEAPAVS